MSEDGIEATGRIVLFGATGYTGELAARALVARGERPVLAGRRADALAELAAELGGLETATADVEQPASVADLVGRGDVLLTTVGPFARWGKVALDAAIGAGAHYVDSTGEPSFIRHVFEVGGPRARESGSLLLTAMGYDWVPGNLAGALALREAGNAATKVRIGYFTKGGGLGGFSGGTLASAVGSMSEPSYQFRGGRLVTERAGRRRHTFTIGGRPRSGVSVGTSEAFALPRSFPGLRDVEVYLGWFGSATRAAQALSMVGAGVARLPGARAGMRAASERLIKTSTGGPTEEERAATGSRFIAEAVDSSGDVLATVRLEGVNGYEFTGRMLAYAASAVAAGDARGPGALGPVDAFGLDRLTEAVAECGISRADP